MLRVVETLLIIIALCFGLIEAIQLTPLTTCTCLGHEVIYECTVHGTGVTNWGGTALEECSAGRILLRHSEYNSSYSVSRTCGIAGLVNARAVSVENETYTSQLILNISNNTIGHTIECSGGSEEGLEHANISLFTVPPQSPINVKLSSIHNRYITYAWDPSDYNCPAIHYLVISSGCGVCPNITHSSNLTCFTELTEHPKLCSLSILTVFCGTIFGQYNNASELRIRVIDNSTRSPWNEIPTDSINTMSASTSEGGRQVQHFATIIGVGSAFVFVAIVLITGIVLASVVAFVKVRGNRRTKQRNFIVQENNGSSLSRNTQNTNRPLPINIQQEPSDYNPVTANNKNTHGNKQAVYAEIGPNLTTKIIQCLDDDRVAYSEIRLPDTQEDNAYAAATELMPKEYY